MFKRFAAGVCLLAVFAPVSSAADKTPAAKIAGQPISPRAKKMAQAMKAGVKDFVLSLQYQGEQGKPFYRLTVSVPAVNRRRLSSFERIAQVKAKDAKRIIDHLAKEGFFDRARKSGKLEKLPKARYLISVRTNDHNVSEILGWGLPLLHRLDSMRNALPDNAKKEMDLLLSRLSGYRAKWEAEALASDGANK